MRNRTGISLFHLNGRARTIVIAAVVFVGAAASWSVRTSNNRKHNRSDIDRLAKAVGDHRVTFARLTGGFSYAPCRVPASDEPLVVGLICGTPKPDTWPQARKLQELARDMSSGQRAAGGGTRQFAGAWHIIWGDLDAAVAELQSAAQSDPRNASLQNDLAVAFLARAEAKQDPVSLLDAHRAADSAVVLDSKLLEARFNRAVVLEWLYLKRDAIAAWSSYLELDSDSRWAGEARSHLEVLQKPAPLWSVAKEQLRVANESDNENALLAITSLFPGRVRDDIRRTVFDWARERQAHSARSDTLLRRAIFAARALRRTTGDGFWSEVTAAIEKEQASGQHARIEATARGLLELERGEAAYDERSVDSAQVWLENAQRSFAAARSPAAHWAAYDAARITYQRGDYVGALARLNRVLESAPASYLVLRGLATRTVAFIEYIGANFDRAMVAYGDAIREGSVLGEPILDLRARTDAARLAATVRGERAAWEPLYLAFRSAAHYVELPRDAKNVFAAAAELSWRKYPAAALLFQAESVRLAAADSNALDMITALTREARLFARTGRSAQAFEALAAVRTYLSRSHNDSVNAELAANADLILGEIDLGKRSDSAIARVKHVVARYQNTHYAIQLTQAKVLLARAYAAAGATDSARRTFEEALAEMERQRAVIGGSEDRAHFLDQARPVIDSVLRFLVDQPDTVGALTFLERMRARVLLERTSGDRVGAAPPAMAIDAIRRTLPRGTTLVSYAVLEGEVIAWLIGRDGIRMYRVPGAHELSTLVERLDKAIASKSGEAAIRPVSSRLYQLLIAPFEQQLASNTQLVVVPDKWLHFVPFAALFDARRQRFLAQSVEIGVVPSIQLYQQARLRYRQFESDAPVSVLAVGNPTFEPRAYAGLPDLPGAQREAARVAERYSHARLLVGRDATKRAFLQAAQTADVIHFAGHGIVRPEAPLMSQLVLAPDPSDESSGALYAKDLFDLRLSRTRLAILSGCHTASGELSDTEGASSLARALFVAGVPAVIASLWAVDDQGTETFFTAFHRELARDQNPTAALHRTQLQWLAPGQDPWRTMSVWGAFQLFGAADSPSNTP
jgi:CHAT domain-containing protein